mmetsp:Transcript_3681/g.6489  ORF Transcript_3681/g.6489 Transcript_3681/m.6489 type:complete len:90 (+) Transcript_3681:435-704(+)
MNFTGCHLSDDDHQESRPSRKVLGENSMAQNCNKDSPRTEYTECLQQDLCHSRYTTCSSGFDRNLGSIGTSTSAAAPGGGTSGGDHSSW